jgi:aminoacrylate peracid reductase
MPKQVIIPSGSPPPIAPYSPGTRAGHVVYTSGLLPLDREGKLIGPGDVRAQTRAVLENIKSVLEAAGGSLSDVAVSMIFLKDLKDFQAMNEVYGEYFKKDPPARWCIGCELVKPEFLVEIQCVAHLA